MEYEIVDESTSHHFKRSLDIRLNSRVSEEVLRGIAFKLLAKDSSEYERTFIVYRLPWMEADSWAWATTHFNPDLDVQILGLSVEDAEALVSMPIPDGREVVGRWLDDTPHMGHCVVIYREKGRLFLDMVFTDGSLREELVAEDSAEGTRYREKSSDHPAAGEYWIIDSAGNLQSHDSEGLISTAQRVGRSDG